MAFDPHAPGDGGDHGAGKADDVGREEEQNDRQPTRGAQRRRRERARTPLALVRSFEVFHVNAQEASVESRASDRAEKRLKKP